MILETTLQGTLHNLSLDTQLAFNQTARLFQSARRMAFCRLNEGLERDDIQPSLVATFGLSARYARDPILQAEATRRALTQPSPEYISQTESKIKKAKRKLEMYLTGKRKPRRVSLEQVTNGLKKRLTRLETKRDRWQAHLEAGTVPPVIFGSAKNFHARRKGEISHRQWQLARRAQFWLRGEKHKKGGNKQAHLFFDDRGRLKISLATLPIRSTGRLVYHTAEIWLSDNNLDKLVKAMTNAFSVRVIRENDAWKIHLTVREQVEGSLDKTAPVGAIVAGLDCNTDCLTVATISAQGNLKDRYTAWMRELPDARSDKANFIISHALDDVLERATEQGATCLVLERLKFAQTHDTERNFNRKTAKFRSTMVKLAVRKALRLGLTVVEVNPAYSSIIGRYKYADGYGLSTHEAAALVIARRGQGREERLPKKIVAKLPALEARLRQEAQVFLISPKKRKALLRWSRILRDWKRKHHWSVWNIWHKTSYLILTS